MAEIKSTLEKVMERLAAMDSSPAEDFRADEKIKEGMRLGADYLKGREISFEQVLSDQSSENISFFRKGLVDVFLRNVVLPRDEDMAMTGRVMQGLLALSGGAGDLTDILGEMKMILDHYLKQKKQYRQQLETAMRRHLEQTLSQQQGGQTDIDMKTIDPTRHPKFQEEWQKIKDGLNEQFGAALEQHKVLISQRLS